MSVIKKVGAVFLAAFILVCSLAVPVFAQEPASFVALPVLPLQSSSLSEAYYAFSSNGARELFISDTQDTVMFYVTNSSMFYIVNSSQNVSYGRFEESTYKGSWSLPTLDNSTGLYYAQLNISRVSDLQCPEFSSFDAGMSAAMTFLESSSTVDQPLTLSVPAGNIAYIEIPSGVANQINATTTSALDHKSPWSGSNQTWGYASSLPSSSLSVPVSGTSSFAWEKAGGTNIFGTTRSWKFFSLLNSSNQYVVIVNPAYPDDQPTNQAINGTISVSLPHASAYRIYSLSTEWSDGSLVGSWDAQSDSTYDGSFDSETDSWSSTDSATGLPGSPQAGGSTIVGQSSQNIHDWLQTIANSISGFFNGAIGAVSTLVGAASDFVSSFIHLYNWLPGSVLSVLTSAMIIAITIGVIKVFI